MLQSKHTLAWACLLACLSATALAENTNETTVTCTVESQEKIFCNGVEFSSVTLDDPQSSIFYFHMGVSLFLVLFAGLMSGLTIGLLSFDVTMLTVLKNGGEPHEQVYAAGILPLVEKKHFLLVTLLLCNAAAMEALPLFLNKMVPEYLAVIISVTAVLLFGEIIPQAICSRFGLAIGYFLAWPVKILMLLLSPLAWPISKVLDLTLGKEEGNYFRRSELKELVYLHGNDDNDEEPLSRDEITIIRGVLDMANKSVKGCLTSLNNVYALDANAYVTPEVLAQIFKAGHSRVPVFKGDSTNIIGCLYVKNLITFHEYIKKEAEKDVYPKVSDLMKVSLLYVDQNMGLYELLNQFQEGRSHMAVVKGEDSLAIGIITLEDVIEELIAEEIVDETDVYVDVQKKIHVVRPISCATKPGLMNLARLRSRTSNNALGLTASQARRTSITASDVVINIEKQSISENTPLISPNQ